MAEFPTQSPIQFHHLPNGQVQLLGRPDVVLKTHEEQAHAEFPAWEQRFGLPTYHEEWLAMSHAQGLSLRFVQFVLCDQSPTKHVGNWPLQPARIRLQVARYLFTLGHTGFVIGLGWLLMLHPKASRPSYLNIPDVVEGDCIVGQAELYDSPLADIAWRGLQEGVFSHTCAVLAQQPEDPVGAGDLVEIALVSEPEASCPGARILKTWTV